MATLREWALRVGDQAFYARARRTFLRGGRVTYPHRHPLSGTEVEVHQDRPGGRIYVTEPGMVAGVDVHRLVKALENAGYVIPRRNTEQEHRAGH